MLTVAKQKLIALPMICSLILDGEMMVYSKNLGQRLPATNLDAHEGDLGSDVPSLRAPR